MTQASEIHGNINQSYQSHTSFSPSGASMRCMSTSTTSTSLMPYDAPSPLRVLSESGGETAPTSSIAAPLNLSILSSTIPFNNPYPVTLNDPHPWTFNKGMA